MTRTSRESSGRYGRVSVPIIAGVVTVGGVFAIASLWLFRDGDLDLPPKHNIDEQSPVEPLQKPEPPRNDYVGSEKCAQCHKDVSDAYQSHPMAHASNSVQAATSVEDYENSTFSMPGRLHYRIEKAENGIWHHESRSDANDEIIYDQAVPVEFEIGSGKRGRSYVINRNGLLFQSPIGWYSGRSRWDLSPGYTVDSNPRFERRLVEACVGCHVGRPAYENKRTDLFRVQPMLEGAISCERCHGPASRHVARYESPEDFQGIDPVVNPAKLPPRERESVCNQCHLQGHDRILRYGRQDRDFRPGNDLADIWTVFVQGSRVGDDGSTRAVSHVEQMRNSECFQKSAGKMGCISCHDPHSSPAEATKTDFFRAKCVVCHQPDSTECSLPEIERSKPPAANSCVYCHMPTLPTNDVPHTSQTDHRILRRRPVDGGGLKSPGRLIIFDDADKRMPKREVDRARGIMMVLEAEKTSNALLASQAESLLRPLIPAAADDVRMREVLGTAASLQGNVADAEKHWLHVLHVDSNREFVLEKLATLAHDTKDYATGLKYLNRLLAINPWRGELHGRKAHMLSSQHRIDEAIETAERGLEIDPTFEQLREWLIQAYDSKANAKERAKHADILRRLRGK